MTARPPRAPGRPAGLLCRLRCPPGSVPSGPSAGRGRCPQGHDARGTAQPSRDGANALQVTAPGLAVLHGQAGAADEPGGEAPAVEVTASWTSRRLVW